jgi:hypothetical protein
MTDKTFRPTLLCDFDGVINSYSSGWQGIANLPDPPVPGAAAFLINASKYFDVAVYSSRSRDPAAIEAMREYIRVAIYQEFSEELKEETASGLSYELIEQFDFPTEKPAAFLTLDDRCLTFTGTFPDPKALREFRPWNKVSDADRKIERDQTILLLGDTPVGNDAMDDTPISLRNILDAGFKSFGWENPSTVTDEAIGRLIDELPHEMRARAAFILGETVSNIIADEKELIRQAEALPDPQRSLLSSSERESIALAKRLARALGGRYVGNRR